MTAAAPAADAAAASAPAAEAAAGATAEAAEAAATPDEDPGTLPSHRRRLHLWLRPAAQPESRRERAGRGPQRADADY